jgi:hypothetical protein
MGVSINGGGTGGTPKFMGYSWFIMEIPLKYG